MASTSTDRAASVDDINRSGTPRFWGLAPIVENDQDAENPPKQATRGTRTSFEGYLPITRVVSNDAFNRPQTRSWALMAVVFTMLAIGLTSMVVSLAAGNKGLRGQSAYKSTMGKGSHRLAAKVAENSASGWKKEGEHQLPEFEPAGICSHVPMEGSVVHKRKDCIQEVWDGSSRSVGAIIYYLCRFNCHVLFVVKCDGQTWEVTAIDPGPCNCSSSTSTEKLNVIREFPQNKSTSSNDSKKRTVYCVDDPPAKFGCAVSDWATGVDRLGRNTHSRRYMVNYVCETGNEEDRCHVAQTLECGTYRRWRILKSNRTRSCDCKETEAIAASTTLGS